MHKYFCIQQEGRRVDAVLDKKERSSKGKARDEQKELRREKKQGRKRVNVLMFLLFNYRVRYHHIYTVLNLYSTESFQKYLRNIN